jgi:ATP-dependent Clp protease adaptor protein ClpS
LNAVARSRGRDASGMLAEMSQTVELPRVRRPGEGSGGLWRVIVLNDDFNTFDHVAETLASVVPGVTLADGYRIADKIHNSGCAIVWSGAREDAEIYWERLDSAGLSMGPLEGG